MMQKQWPTLSVTELDRTLECFRTAQKLPRPRQGWIRAVREALGVSAGELGRLLGVSRQLPLQFEKAEADDSITLKSLRSVAGALGCDLVYALVPRAVSMRDLVENPPAVAAGKLGKRAKLLGAPRIHGAAQIKAEIESGNSAIDGDTQDPYFCD
jgi:predicted DNA-binding mobile mystery protein A